MSRDPLKAIVVDMTGGEENYRLMRNHIIEECARLMESQGRHYWYPKEAAAALRAQKDKQS